MLILSACSDIDILKLLVYIKLIINILKIAAPIIVIIMAGIDVIKAVMANNQENIQKNIKRIPSRLLLCAILFLLPTVIFWSVDLIDSSNEVAACWDNANAEDIAIAYQDIALDAIEQAEKEKTQGAYNSALVALSKVADEDVKAVFNKRLEKVHKSIKDKDKTDLSTNAVDIPYGVTTEDITKTESDIANEAQKYVGLKYRYGTEDLNVSVDCSGFTQQIFKKFGITLPRSADAQSRSSAINVNGLANAQAGDLLFYDWENDGKIDHVAIYLGNNKRIHASGGKSCPDPKKACQVKIDSSCMNSIVKIKRFVKNS